MEGFEQKPPSYSTVTPPNYDSKPFESIEEYLDFMDQLQADADQFKWYEIQAHNFAGLILVPPDPLKKSVERHAAALKKQFKEPVMDLESAWSYMASAIADEFQVSASVIEKRIMFDSLKTKFPLS